MVRKLASVLVSLAVISPAWVHALGLGGIELNSFLNQPLDAQIEILSSKKGETDGLRVGLASQQAFANAGLDYNDTIRKLKFNIVKKSNGKHYIKVSTRKGYREPFLNFLLEVNWANGRILREYAELVDPPALVRSSQSSNQAAAISRPATSTSSQSRSQQVQAPTYRPAVSASAGGYVGDTYTTRRNDTAWKIAKTVRPDDQVTVEQSMMALLRANPNAFIKQNINRLKAGYTLNIPDRETMLQQSHSDARADVRRQTREWRNRRRPVAAAPKGRLEILPPKADAGTDDKAATSSEGTGTETSREAMLARESAEAQRQENAELKLRVSELEEQIANAKRLTELKADQMAALEKKLAEVNAAAAAAAASTTTDAPAEAAAAEPAATETPAEPAAEEAVAAEPETPVEEEATPAAPSEVVEAVTAKPGTPINQHVVTGFEPVDVDSLPKSELPEEPFKTTETVVADEPAEASVGIIERVIEYFKQNPLVKWIAAAVGGLLVLILGMMMVRRGRGDEQFEESILHEQPVEETRIVEEEPSMLSEAEPVAEAPESVDMDDQAEGATKEITDTSFMSDMVLSDMSDLEGEGGGSDPLTEADVFLAYGRFDPAENMIKSAIAKEPNRNDLKLKLLEIYYSSKNKDAFESEAAALKAELDNNPDPETWEKVVEMGEDLSPGNNLFAGAGAIAAAAATTALVTGDDEDTEAMDFDLGEFEDKIDDMSSDASVVAENTLDDDLDLDLDKMLLEGSADDDMADTLEFSTELDSLKGTSDGNTTEITKEMDGIAEIDSANRDPDITRRIVTDQAPINDEITAELEDIAGVLKSDTSEKEEITRKIVADSETLSNEITQELEMPDLSGDDTPDDSLSMDEDLDLDDDSLADIDEVGTKLDLARAYIDMGDPEGARSILDEVVEEGNEIQKNEAEELLTQI